MKNDVLKEMEQFLNKETPIYGGCMVCCAIDKNDRQQLLLIERRKLSNCDSYTINMRMFYDYDFLWEERKEDWKILWKYDRVLDEEKIKKSRKQDVEDFIEWEEERKRDRCNGAGTD